MSACCDTSGHTHSHSGPDRLLWGCSLIIGVALIAYFACNILHITAPVIHHFGGSILDLMKTMWWGVLAGLLFVGLMGRVPKEYFTVMLGRGDSAGGILRAAAAGVLLDLCSHGILMVGAKLYERGSSLGQVMTFLISSPWNSFSLTLILIAMIGFKWTMLFIAGSMVIAIITGLLYQALIRAKILPDNPHAVEMPENFDIIADIKTRLKSWRPNAAFWGTVFSEGWRDGKMVLRWLAFGIILTALIRTFVPVESFASWFAPTMAGLMLTLLATTIIEVCSEGSSPIGADLVMRAHAPGNGFTFLMAGVSTDYTEIMVLKNLTRSWKIALSLPLLTVPQIMLLGWIMNQATP